MKKELTKTEKRKLKFPKGHYKEVQKIISNHILPRYKKNKKCKKCNRTGAMGANVYDEIVPCDRCVDKYNMFIEWKAYVVSNEDLLKYYFHKYGTDYNDGVFDYDEVVVSEVIEKKGVVGLFGSIKSKFGGGK